MSTAKLEQASRLLLQASDLLSDTTALASKNGASMDLLASTHAKIGEGFTSIEAKNVVAARKQLKEARKLFLELKIRMPHRMEGQLH